MSITSNVIGYPKQLWLENIQVLCVGALSVIDIDNIKLTGFIGQGLKITNIKTVHVEDSTFIYAGDPIKSIINIASAGGLASFTMKNSSVIHSNEMGWPLSANFWSSSGDVRIFIENT